MYFITVQMYVHGGFRPMDCIRGRMLGKAVSRDARGDVEVFKGFCTLKTRMLRQNTGFQHCFRILSLLNLVWGVPDAWSYGSTCEVILTTWGTLLLVEILNSPNLLVSASGATVVSQCGAYLLFTVG